MLNKEEINMILHWLSLVNHEHGVNTMNEKEMALKQKLENLAKEND